ncbi:hypothetical protein [Nostoc sp. LEGE 06077]|uniref:hypothetical protein n=1 Tax=Nostoc sp. LEGE 06077 TaxID=915325 RepID=UPI001D15C5DE|nr:hypothetical protein [Nostoc sp. LEGE 06077]
MFEHIPIQKMASYVDLSKFWTDDKNLTIQKAHEMTGIDKRTLSVAKRGFLDRCQIETLIKLQAFASELAGRKVSLEEMVRTEGS